MAFRFPFSTLHELNLDWILEKVKTFAELIPPMETAVEEVQSLSGDVQQAVEDAQEALEDAGEALQTAEEAKEIAEQAAQGVIADNAVTTAKIADGAVTNPKLAANSVNTSNIINGSVTAEKLADSALALIPHFAVPTREWNHITTQAEFETYLAKFNNGEVSWNCYFDAPGTYKIKLPNNTARLVLTSIQAHWVATVDGVTLDLNGCVIYTSHIQISGVTKTLGDPYTFTIVNSNTDETPYFEGCSLILNYCTFAMMLRLWSCNTTATYCRFTNDTYTPNNACSIDVIQGSFNSNNNYFDYNYNTITATDFAIFGVGNSPKICLSGRSAVKDSELSNINIYLFRNRQIKNQFEIFFNGSFYSIDYGGAYNGTNARGHLIPATFSDIGMVAIFGTQAASEQFGYLFAPNSTMKCSFQVMESKTFE